MSDRELRIAIAREALGWKRLRELADGQINGEHDAVLTHLPKTVPDWMNDEEQLARLEFVARRRFGSVNCRDGLAEVAGAFNPQPTARQRCEAVLLAARRARDERLD